MNFTCAKKAVDESAICVSFQLQISPKQTGPDLCTDSNLCHYFQLQKL